MNHLWQRFLLASSLLVGLAIGIALTVFGYSNLAAVDVHWSVFQIRGVPLWTVTVVPVALVLIAGTLYHWIDGLHHFTEHMRHRGRVHELEAELTSVRSRLDQVLAMPGEATAHEPTRKKGAALTPPPDEEMAGLGSTEPVEHHEETTPVPAAVASPAEPNGAPRKSRKRVSLKDTVTAANGEPESVAAPEPEPEPAPQPGA